MVERLGWTLVHFVWEGAAVAASLALALLLLRRASPALRYVLACAALFALAVLPVATFLMLDPATRAEGAALAGGPTRAAERWTSGTAVFAPSSAQARLPAIVGIWAAGVAALSLRLAGTLLQLERWRRRHARPAEADWQARLDELADRLGIVRSVRLLVSDRLVVPSAWGVLRPLVVLPASLLTSLPPVQVESILLHELAHIRRHDYLVNLAQAVVETALFYHPAVWWVSSVVRREREHCCDDAVVATLGDPLPYARALLHLEERRHVLPHPTLSAKEGKLMNRIARILGGPPAPVRLSPLASLLAALGVVGLVSGGVLQAQAQETKRPASPAASRKTTAAKVRPPATKAAKTLAKPTSQPPLAARAAPGKSPLAAVKAALARRQATGAKTAPSVPALVLPKAAKATTVVPARGGGIPKVGAAAGPTKAVAAVGATPPSAAPASGGALAGGFGGGGFGGAPDPAQALMDAMRVEKQGSGLVSVDLDHAPFDMALRKFARQTGLSIVIVRGAYVDITMVLHDLPVERALTVLCRAAGANMRQEAGVWYVMPFTSPLVVPGNTDRLVIASSPAIEPRTTSPSGAVPGP